MLQAEGRDPYAEARNLLQMGYRYERGSDQERAQIIANIYKSRPVPYEMLAAALDGTAPPQGTQQSQAVDPNAIAEQVWGSIQQRINQQSTQRATSEGQRAVQEFAASEPEFLEDVREDMGLLMETAARRGKTLTLQEAYDKACKLHPEVSAALSRRKEAESVKAQQANVQKSVAAGGSVRNQPAGPVVNGQGSGNVRDTIEGILASRVR